MQRFHTLLRSVKQCPLLLSKQTTRHQSIFQRSTSIASVVALTATAFVLLSNHDDHFRPGLSDAALFSSSRLHAEEGETSVNPLQKMRIAHVPPIISKNEQALQLIQQLECDPDFERVTLPPDRPARPSSSSSDDTDTVSTMNSDSGSDSHFRQYLLSKKQGTLDVKKFEYVSYFSKRQQKSIVVVYFGPHMEGPPGCSHGGSMATILDSVMTANVWRCDLFALTANLTVNYRKFMPLESVVICESKILAVDGRKIKADGVLKSIDGKTVHVESTGLWITVAPEKFYEALDQATLQQRH